MQALKGVCLLFLVTYVLRVRCNREGEYTTRFSLFRLFISPTFCMALQFLCPCFILVFRPLGSAVNKTAACFWGRDAKAVVVVVVHVGLGFAEQNPAQCVDVSYQCLCRVHWITLTAVDHSQP